MLNVPRTVRQIRADRFVVIRRTGCDSRWLPIHRSFINNFQVSSIHRSRLISNGTKNRREEIWWHGQFLAISRYWYTMIGPAGRIRSITTNVIIHMTITLSLSPIFTLQALRENRITRNNCINVHNSVLIYTAVLFLFPVSKIFSRDPTIVILIIALYNYNYVHVHILIIIYKFFLNLLQKIIYLKTYNNDNLFRFIVVV